MNHDKMIEVLMNVEIDSRDILITANLHWKQTARVRSDDQLLESNHIMKSIIQNCVLFHLLFNVYSKVVVSKGLETTKGA